MLLVLFNQSGPGSDGNEGVLRIPQTSPSDCLVSYPRHSLGGSNPSAEMQLVYSTAQVFGEIQYYISKAFDILT